MRDRQRAAQLRELVIIRDLKFAAAERTARECGRDLTQAGEALHQADEQLSSTLGHWNAALDMPPSDLMIVGAWATDVRTCRDAAKRDATRKEEAASALGNATHAWRVALSERDRARGIAQDAAKAVRRKSEEHDLIEASDRHAARKGPL